MYDRAEQLIAFTFILWYVNTRFLNRIWLVTRYFWLHFHSHSTPQASTAPQPAMCRSSLMTFIVGLITDGDDWKKKGLTELCAMELPEPPPDQFWENQGAGEGLQQTIAFSTCTMCVLHICGHSLLTVYLRNMKYYNTVTCFLVCVVYILVITPHLFGRILLCYQVKVYSRCWSVIEVDN